ncbi:MAG TPA: hypothetical protein VHL55_02125 [Acidimicrobiia bacterium]|nr:hypothetical protein [Acidimicrobiia bacterium]
MTLSQRVRTFNQPGYVGRRAGFVATIAVNLAMFWVVNNLLTWGVVPFLTAEFRQVLWLIELSLAATILINASWLAYDVTWFRSLGQIFLNVLSAVVAISIYRVFPFDFSVYEFAWEPVARAVIVLTVVGIVFGTVAELIKLARMAFPTTRSNSQ